MTPANYNLNDLLSLMERLRDTEYGCPWDIDQSYRTIVSSTLEEVYEVVDAIEQDDYSQLKEELGDLLFQVIFYSQLAKEEGRFNFELVVSSITEKLLRRHPHVYPDGTLNSKSALVERKQHEKSIKQAWEAIKKTEREEKGHHSLMDDIPLALPAVVRAAKIQKRASSVKFDWPEIDGVYAKIQEEIEELNDACLSNSTEAIEEEFGDLLFTVVNLARHLNVEPELALRKANRKFEKRFRGLEQLAQDNAAPISNQTPETLNLWWEQVKNDNV